MAARRKSSTPCMVRLTDVTEPDDSEEMDVSQSPPNDASEYGSSLGTPKREPALGRDPGGAGSETAEKQKQDTEQQQPRRQQGGGYECKYCPFSTQNLNNFKEHVDSSHPNVILNPLYLCVVCNFNTKKFDTLTEHNEKRHPGESNFKFKRIKVNGQTILEQTIEGVSNAVFYDTASTQGREGPFTFSKSPTMKIRKPKTDNKHGVGKTVELVSSLDGLSSKDQITAINVNGTVIIPEATMKGGLSHVMPLLQRPPNFNSIPKIAVPLNSTKYNSALDNNMTLITSFNKFPYPTHAELSWLTAASKHPEEQIKVWFTTQRLKQGITWSPEEVEEARKKMFNGSIPPVHQTFTVLPAQLTKPAKATQPLIQTVPCQLLGQSSLVLTTIANGSAVTCSPIALTVANQVQALKRPLAAPAVTAQVKRSMTALVLSPESKQPMAVPEILPESKRPTATPAITQESKRPTATPAINQESKRPMVTPAINQESKRPMVTPAINQESKRPMVTPAINQESKRPMVTPVITQESKRPMAAPESKTLMAPPTIIPELKQPMVASVQPPESTWLTTPTINSELNRPMAPPVAPPTAKPLTPQMVISGKQTITGPAFPPELKRPTIIQSVQKPFKVASPMPSFSLDYNKSGDHNAKLRFSYEKSQYPEDKEVSRLSEETGLSRGEVRKWFSDQRCLNHKGNLHMSEYVLKDTLQKPVPTQFPLLDRVKGKTAEQLKILEESFQRNSFPTQGEFESLVSETRLSRTEIDCWFSERRALRDNLEQALLSTMGTRKVEEEERWQPGVPNGVHAPLPLCPTSVDGKSLGLLKDMFAQTRWPKPEEYSQLEIQTGMARTEIVRWFKDNRSFLKNGKPEWMELFQEMKGTETNGRGALPTTERAQNVLLQHYQGVKAPVEADVERLSEHAKLCSQEITDWFTNKLGQKVSDAVKNGGQDRLAKENPSSWVEVTMGVDTSLGQQELVSDTDGVVKTSLEG